MDQLGLFEYDQLEQNDRHFIQGRTLEIKSLVKRSARDIVEIGLKLIEVKERLPHGMWGEWLDREFGWTQMTAFRFMNVAIKFNNLLNLENFGQSALYLLASPSTPEEAIGEAIDRATQGETITHKTAKEIVKNHKENTEGSQSCQKERPSPLEMADDAAGEDLGYTEEEWDKKPHSYMGDCFKQCYAPGLMVKGDVWEYGVRGVYVCSGCGYAYPPMVEPNEVDLEEYNRINQLEEDEEESKKPHSVHFSSESPEWYTPKHIIDRVIETFGGAIDLDPCSNSADNPNVPALNHFTKQDDGLSQFWKGRVYMNSPYGNELSLWVNKILEEYQNDRITEAIILAPARTDTKWFQSLRQFPKCFIAGRLKFVGGNNSAPFPSMLVYLGPNNEEFFTSFSDIGDIYELRRFGHIEKQ
ncbi:MAG: DNA N-6-adenine-methyltransferase [Planctomycetota bacterium]|jgi:hypothetical protein